MSTVSQQSLDSLFENRTSVIARDLRINLGKVLDGGSLSPDEAYLALLASAASVQHRRLASFAVERLEAMGVGADAIREAEESAALVGMLNIYYRFRHFVGNSDDYRVASLRMTALARPVLGKERFEMLAFAVSVLNGCETCTRAHEKTLRDAGVSTDKIHDLARLAAVVNGIQILLKED